MKGTQQAIYGITSTLLLLGGKVVFGWCSNERESWHKKTILLFCLMDYLKYYIVLKKFVFGYKGAITQVMPGCCTIKFQVQNRFTIQLLTLLILKWAYNHSQAKFISFYDQVSFSVQTWRSSNWATIYMVPVIWQGEDRFKKFFNHKHNIKHYHIHSTTWLGCLW